MRNIIPRFPPRRAPCRMGFEYQLVEAGFLGVGTPRGMRGASPWDHPPETALGCSYGTGLWRCCFLGDRRRTSLPIAAPPPANTSRDNNPHIHPQPPSARRPAPSHPEIPGCRDGAGTPNQGRGDTHAPKLRRPMASNPPPHPFLFRSFSPTPNPPPSPCF